MANLKISELPNHGAQQAGDQVVGNRSGSSGRILLSAPGIVIPDWDAEADYSEGQLSRDPHDRLFVAIADITGDASNVSPAQSASWMQVGNFAGTYQRAEAYPVGSILTYSGNVWFVGTAVPSSNTSPPGTNTAFIQINGGSSGSSFTPSQTNLYDAVKEILHPSNQAVVSADDSNHEIDINVDTALLEGVAADTLTFWSPTAQHTVADALDYGDVVTIRYGSASSGPTVLAAYREDHTVTLILATGTDWAAVSGEANATITNSDGVQFGAWISGSVQTSQAAVTASGQWFYQDNIPAAGAVAWREMARIDELDNTHLGIGPRDADSLQITSSTGDNINLPSASNTQAGLESAADKELLEAVPPKWTPAVYSVGAQRAWAGIIYECRTARDVSDTDNPSADAAWVPLTALGATDLSLGTRTATAMDVDSSSGDDVTLPSATTSAAGLQSAADKTKADAQVPEWTNVTYAEAGIQRVHDGVLYETTQAISAATGNDPSADTTNWRKITVPDVPSLANYRTATQITAEITTDIAAAVADAVNDKGAYDSTDDYGANDQVVNDGATYIAKGNVAANSDAVTEPGAGSNWEASWRRVGFEEGPGDAFTGVTVNSSGGVTFTRRDGTNPDTIATGVADPTRAERVTFQAVAQTNALQWATPITTDPVTVAAGTGDPEIITAVSGNPAIDLSVTAGVYLIDIVGEMDGAGANNDCVFWLTDTSGNILDASTPVALDSSERTMGAKLALVLEADTDVRIRLRPLSGQTAIAANWTATFIRWGGGRETRTVQQFAPSMLGTTTFAGTGAAQNVALTNSEGNALVVPADGWIIAVSNIAPINLEGAVSWHLAEDLRDADQDTSLTLSLYTNNDNELLAYVNDTTTTASAGNEIVIFQVGTTDASSGSSSVTPQPTILRFDVTGDRSPAAGSIAGETYDYISEISQSGHVGSARIIGFIGTSDNPTNFDTLATLTSANYHHAEGSLTIPNGVSLNANQTYTIRLEVYPDGTPNTGAPTIYHDYRITAHAVAASVHFGRQTGAADYAAAAAALTDFSGDISTQAAAAGSYDVSGIPQDSNLYRLYWAVPSSLTQPTGWSQGGIPITASVDTGGQSVTIGGVQYTVYFTDADYDDTSNGNTTIVVT